jgi:hypothetical protein
MLGCLWERFWFHSSGLWHSESDIAKESHCLVENTVARLASTCLLERCNWKEWKICRRDTVPAPVYVANHASQVDVGAVYFVWNDSSGLPKSGALHTWGGTSHVSIEAYHDQSSNEQKQNSVNNLFVWEIRPSCAVRNSHVSFLRRLDVSQKKLPFKDGAFIVAQNNCSPLVPLSIWNSHQRLE